jgi:hypothetical protein
LRCNECQRKFSIAHIQRNPNSKQFELSWLINEVGMLTAKLTDLLSDLDVRLELLGTRVPENNLAGHDGNENQKC